MRPPRLIALFVSLCVLASTVLAGCDALSAVVSPPTPTPAPAQLIVGRWERVTARKLTPPISALLPDQVEFLKDGTWVVPGSGVINGRYAFLDPGRVKLEGLGVVFTPGVSFTPSGASMVLDEGGEKVEFRRKN